MSIIVIFAALFSCMFSTTVNAISEKCVSSHFENLANNANVYAPQNAEGSCAYVALSMLLSFYDTYWNDRFVPDSLEWDIGSYNSAGDALGATFNANSEYVAYNSWRTSNPSSPYNDFVDENLHQLLHPYLISLGESLWYHGIIDNDFGLYDWQTVNVLKKYLYDIVGFTEDEVVVNYLKTDDETLFSTMKTIIDDGYPVIYTGNRFDLDLPEFEDSSGDSIIGGHVMIAYAVEQNNGQEDIKLHMGWNVVNNPTSWISTTEYKYNNGIIWLEIIEENLPHVCSNNYMNSSTNEPLCACQIYSSHPMHDNNHIVKEQLYDDNNHYNICHCGEIIDIQPHSLSYSITWDTEHYETCSNCNYRRLKNHEKTTFANIVDANHTWICACGCYGTEAHYRHSYERYTQNWHYVYCECGHRIGTDFHIVPAGNAIYKFCIHCGERINTKETFIPTPAQLVVVPEIQYITDAGSYIDSNCVVYLVESDMALYLAGELDIHELIRNLNSSTM